jgi:hypothetical protein
VKESGGRLLRQGRKSQELFSVNYGASATLLKPKEKQNPLAAVKTLS